MGFSRQVLEWVPLYRISFFSAPSPAFVICRLFDDGHFDWCEVVPHCSFYLMVKLGEKMNVGILCKSSAKIGEGNGTPLQYSCLENPMDGGAWWAAVHGVTKSRTRLSDFTFMNWRGKWQPTPVFLPGESQGWGSLVGCRLWGHTESDTTEVT